MVHITWKKHLFQDIGEIILMTGSWVFYITSGSRRCNISYMTSHIVHWDARIHAMEVWDKHILTTRSRQNKTRPLHFLRWLEKMIYGALEHQINLISLFPSPKMKIESWSCYCAIHTQHGLSHLAFPRTLAGRFYYHPHF